MTRTGTICVGLDGASWDVVDPLIEAGELPTLERLRKEGVRSENRSCLPPATFPNWKCYSTGKNPGGFGSFWFEDVDFEGREITVPDSRSFQSAELWDYLGEAGHTVGVVNVPTTYPPKPVDGYLVAGGPGAGDAGYTYPAALEGELIDRYDYRVHPKQVPINKNDWDSAAIDSVHQVIKSRFDVAHDILDRGVDFLSLTVFYINVLQHYYGVDAPVVEGWRIIDEHLAELEERCENLVVMSDHGSGEIRTVFWVNTWLEREGYLRTTSGVGDSLFSALGNQRDRILDIARAAGLETALRALTPAWLKRRIQPDGAFQQDSKESLIDWEETVALGSGQGPIYLDRGGLANDEYERLRTELIERFGALSSPMTGEPIAEGVHRGEEVYSGPYIAEGPDLVVEQRDGVHINGGIGRDAVFEGPSKWHSENYRAGVFLLHSEYGRAGEWVDGLNITDLTPTILHLVGEAVPTDIHGKVRTDIFVEGSPPAQREVSRREPLASRQIKAGRDDSDDVVSRLQDLGYLS